MKKILFVSFFDYNISKNFFTLLSSLKRFYSEGEYEYRVFVDKFTAANFRKSFSELGVVVTNIDSDLDAFAKNKMLNNSITKMTMGRLLLPELIKDYNKFQSIIYLDVDILVNNKIDKKFISSRDNYAVVDYNPKNLNRKKDLMRYWNYNFTKIENGRKILSIILTKYLFNNYFNAGVLIINNMKSFKSLAAKAKNSEYFLDDQTLLNLYNIGEIIVEKDIRLNYQLARENLKNSKTSFFIHFSESIKPWSESINEKVNSKYKNKIIGTNYYKIQKEAWKNI